jgi:hypothetical protein
MHAPADQNAGGEHEAATQHDLQGCPHEWRFHVTALNPCDGLKASLIPNLDTGGLLVARVVHSVSDACAKAPGGLPGSSV